MLRFEPLTCDRWQDLELLFGPKGACAGCWCMWWRLPRRQWKAQKGEQNREALRALVESGVPLGLLAYRDGRPVGWCAVAPRESFVMLERSRQLKRIDGRGVWSVTCLFVERKERRKGVSTALLEAAAAYVRREGGDLVEGYPVDPRGGETADAFAWTGTVAAFQKAGFTECARPSATRAIVRRAAE